MLVCRPGEAQQNGLIWTPDMPYARPSYPLEKVDEIGQMFAGLVETPEDLSWLEEAIDVVDNWRTSHLFPLTAFRMTLRNRARSIDPQSIESQRIKRRNSIIKKLERRTDVRLTEIQDIGGCRAVMNSVEQVYELVNRYDVRQSRHELIGRNYDRIRQPLASGYRSVHRVYRFVTPLPDKSCYNGLRIEIQFRSRLQHAWATAVETVDAFTEQDLKSGHGDPQWLRFFALVSSAFARKEGTQRVPRTPSGETELITEIMHLTHTLDVFGKLGAFRIAANSIRTQRVANAKIFLVVLDVEERKVRTTSYTHSQRYQATTALLDAEKNRKLYAVLVVLDSINDLHRAYPNLFADTGEFLAALREVIS